ncbi:MAG: histidine phosphatase family protein, partial [Pseudomonadota bacterium]
DRRPKDMTAIALMRHYPTSWNAEARLQGQADIPLTDTARETLRGLTMPDPWRTARLICSPLSRAAETADLLADGRAPTHDARLMELSWGEWEGQRAEDLLADPASGFRPTHEWDADTAAPGGESASQAWERTRPALADVTADPSPAVIVTHKALMRLILTRAGVEEPEIKRGRLYPLTLGKTGLPSNPGPAVRLEQR